MGSGVGVRVGVRVRVRVRVGAAQVGTRRALGVGARMGVGDNRV